VGVLEKKPGKSEPSSAALSRRFSHRTPAGLCFGFGLPQARDPVAWLPLAALLQNFKALEAFEHIPFAAQSGGCA